MNILNRITGVVILLLIEFLTGSSVQAANLNRTHNLSLAAPAAVCISGVLDTAQSVFGKTFGISVRIVSATDGGVIRYGERGEVDIVMMHDDRAQNAYVTSGYGVRSRKVMYGDFVVLGPKKDPIHIAWEKNAIAAFSKIAAEQATFISRSDGSAVNSKENEIWHKAGHLPTGAWYVSVGQSMAGVLMIAGQKQAYTLADRATYSVLEGNVNLDVVFEGDSLLFDNYFLVATNPKKYPRVNYDQAAKFIDWLTTRDGQACLAVSGKKGSGIFFPCYGKPDALRALRAPSAK